MKTLLGQWHSFGYAGTQTWNYTLARELRKMGHDVEFYVGGRGMFAARCMNEGFHTWSYVVGDRPTADLAIISQPRMYRICRVCGDHPLMETDPPVLPEHVNLNTGKKCLGSGTDAVDVLPDCARMYVMHGWLPHDAPLVDGSPYVTVSKETHDRLKQAYGIDSIQVNQPIDLCRFVPREPLRDEPVAAVLSTWPAEQHVIEKACEEAGVKLEYRGGQVWNVPELMNGVDILIGTGRGVAEAMACGRAAVICGKFGSDGYVCPELWERQLAVNLSGRATMTEPAESLASALKQYDPSIGAWARDTAERVFDPRTVAEQILETVH